MINTAIAKLAAGQNLAGTESREAFDQIMSGGATNAQIAAFITAMRMKGETIDEITACAQVLREKCSRIHTQGDVLDIVGTGGDCANTFNISTTSAFVISAAGQPVAKHGNRSVSSKSGAADVLEALGVKIDLPAEKNEELLQKINLCFLFAQSCHASMRYAGPVRKEIGIRTIFNIIGPLANPAFASLQLLGVYQKELVLPLSMVSSARAAHSLMLPLPPRYKLTALFKTTASRLLPRSVPFKIFVVICAFSCASPPTRSALEQR